MKNTAIALLALLLVLMLGFGVHVKADGTTGFSLIIQQAGVTQGAAVTVNFGSGTTVTLSGGVANVTATAMGGSVTSITFNCGLTPATVTTSATIGLDLIQTPVTNPTYTVVQADCGRLVNFNNAG